MQNDSSISPDVSPRFARVVAYYGADGFQRIRAARVAVIGLGGVGTHAGIALARSGVGRLLLMDFDEVTPSTLNRNPIAGPGDVGRPKVDVLTEHLRLMCPETVTYMSRAFCDAKIAAEILDPPPAVVVDAIDSLNPKVDLLEYCVRRQIPVISSLGASGRRDPTRVRIADVAATHGCPLGRQVRRRLRRRGIESGVRCVYSDEAAPAVLPPDDTEPHSGRGRVRHTLPSQITLPGIFGYTLATVVLERLTAGAGGPPQNS